MSASPRIPKHSSDWFGWIPDLPDHRDHLYSDIKPKVRTLPSSVDLRTGCPPVENQGALGSCTANALIGALEFLEKKAGRPLVHLSRLFVYYNARAIEGKITSKGGCFMRHGIKSLAKQGVCGEQIWPYRIRHYAKKPPAITYRQASQHRIARYHRIHTLEEMRACLAEGFPFVFGFTVYTTFVSQAVRKSGILHLPHAREKAHGGHSVMAVGFDDASKRFLIRNSWGRKWGQQGYFTIPYAYLQNRSLADDFWTIRF